MCCIYPVRIFIPGKFGIWKYVWVNPPPGAYKIRVRAIDGKDKVEDWEPRSIFPDGTTGQEALSVVVT